MGMLKVSKGKSFIQQNMKMSELYLIVQGKVSQIHGSESYLLETGSLVGLAECNTGIYQSEYVAVEDCVLYTFPYEKPQDFKTIFESQPKYAVAFLQAVVKQAVKTMERYQKLRHKAEAYYAFVVEAYKQYCQLCEKYGLPEKSPYYMENLTNLQLEGMLADWDIAYYRELAGVSSAELEQFYGKNHTLVIGEILHTVEALCVVIEQMDIIHEYLVSNQEILLRVRKDDLFDLYQELAISAAAGSENLEDILESIEKLKEYITSCELYEEKMVSWRFEEFDRCDFADIHEKSQKEKELLQQRKGVTDEDCLSYILSYANYGETQVQHVRDLLKSYRRMEEDYSVDDAARRIRKELTTTFFDVYKKAFRESLTDQDISPIVQMFLMFGFLDMETAGEENVKALYELTDKIKLCRGEHIYTMYDWLRAIYAGEQEPSRNEFDLDYNGYLHEQIRMGHISGDQEQRLLTDNWEKVVFEIDNMFASASRATYGKLSTYCPILSSGDVVGSIEKMLVTAARLEEAMNAVRKIDFSLFYHEVIFSDPQHGVNKEMIQKEILPDIILMPSIGSRAMMWQETAGLKRDTSARFVFPIFTAEKLDDMMVATCGRYRWEICRKIQGMRWNDITERSLTSEYCDYIQFYRKNHDLSAETKEKIKSALTRAKNNYREVFVMDYMVWIRYEANGSFRLNRVTRDIMFRYCPFNKEIRSTFSENPMYQDIYPKYQILVERQLRHLRAFIEKYLKNGGTMTLELMGAQDFFDK